MSALRALEGASLALYARTPIAGWPHSHTVAAAKNAGALPVQEGDVVMVEFLDTSAEGVVVSKATKSFTAHFECDDTLFRIPYVGGDEQALYRVMGARVSNAALKGLKKRKREAQQQ